MADLILEDDGMCFACGEKNPAGLKLKFKFEGESIKTRFNFQKIHQGYKNIVHGGFIALILDEAMGNLIYRCGKRGITAQLELRIKQPTFVGQTLYFTAWIEKEDEKIIYAKAEARRRDGLLVAYASSKNVKLKKMNVKKQILTTKAIIFDLDGVITDTMLYHYRAWKKVFNDTGINVSRFDVYIREGQQGISTVREVFREKNKDIENKKAKELLIKKERLFKRIVKRKFFPGALCFLKTLHRQGFKLGLVTGTSASEVEEILPADIYNIFDVIIAGDDCKHGKPHPEPYLKAIKRLGLGSSSALVIENAPSGIEAAKRAKLYCLALATSLGEKYLNAADAVFSSISELRRKVDFRKKD